MASFKATKYGLEELYNRYNRREFVHPDPLEFLYNYDDPKDIEIAGLIASSLAYGRVAQILKSVDIVLSPMGKSPRKFITEASAKNIIDTYKRFKHRFTTDKDMTALLLGIKGCVKKHGSLNDCFLSGFKETDSNIIPALESFVVSLCKSSGNDNLQLLPPPGKGSACKRLNLYLRWMIRNDEVDPGCWKRIPASRLIVPLDTHMQKIGIGLGFTKRNQANMKTALEISSAFAALSPEDPVKYDFALTRFGIRSDLSMESILG